MREKCFRLRALIPVIVLAFALCACAGQAARSGNIEFALSDVRMEDGSYAFPTLVWGSTKGEVEAALGKEFPHPQTDGEHTDIFGHTHQFTSFALEHQYRLNGNVGYAHYQFRDDQLFTVTVSFKDNMAGPNDIAKLSKALMSQGDALFGSAAEDISEDRVLNNDALEFTAEYKITRKQWNNIDPSGVETRVQLSLMEPKDGEGSFSIMLAYLDQDHQR